LFFISAVVLEIAVTLKTQLAPLLDLLLRSTTAVAGAVTLHLLQSELRVSGVVEVAAALVRVLPEEPPHSAEMAALAALRVLLAHSPAAAAVVAQRPPAQAARAA
jgi:hypothetical protein